MQSRRKFLAGAATVGAIGLAPALSGCASTTRSAALKGKVVIVGAGYGGSTAAKYIRDWSNNSISVTVVEPGDAFVSLCPALSPIWSSQGPNRCRTSPCPMTICANATG
jgi:hypothetical protein